MQKEGLDESSVEEKSLVQDSFYSVTDGKEDESAISFASVDDTFQSEKKADTFLDESMGADGSASAAEDSIREEEHNNRSEADGGDSSIMDLAMTPRPGHDTVNILAHEETPKSTLLSSAFAATVVRASLPASQRFLERQECDYQCLWCKDARGSSSACGWRSEEEHRWRYKVYTVCSRPCQKGRGRATAQGHPKGKSRATA